MVDYILVKNGRVIVDESGNFLGVSSFFACDNPIRVSDPSDMSRLLVASKIGFVVHYLGPDTDDYESGALYQVQDNLTYLRVYRSNESNVAWNIIASHSLPDTGELGDIVIVPNDPNAPLPDISKLKSVASFYNLDTAAENTYPDNTISFFDAVNSTPGDIEYTIEKLGYTVEKKSAAAIINLNGEQYDAVVYYRFNDTWVEFPFYKLPLVYRDLLNLATWLGTDAELGEIPDLWEELGLSENYENAPVIEGGTTETLDLETWLGKLTDFGTIDDLWVVLGLTESATQATNHGEPIPIT